MRRAKGGWKASYKDTEDDIGEADKEWQEILEKMLYAFDVPEPDIMAYDFKLDMQFIEDESLPKGCGRIEFLCSNEEEYARYNADMEVHEAKVAEGHRLFGEYYQCLWW